MLSEKSVTIIKPVEKGVATEASTMFKCREWADSIIWMVDILLLMMISFSVVSPNDFEAHLTIRDTKNSLTTPLNSIVIGILMVYWS